MKPHHKPLIWLKRFSPDANFVVAKSGLVMNGEKLEVGSDFDKSSVNVRRLRQMYESRRIAIKSEEVLTSDEKSDTVELEIRSKGPAWFGVFKGDEQIGKSVRTEEEAKKIIAEYA